MLSMTVGLLRPDEGHSRVFGIDVWREPQRARELMGVLPDGLAMPEQLTGRELLSYLGQLLRSSFLIGCIALFPQALVPLSTPPERDIATTSCPSAWSTSAT